MSGFFHLQRASRALDQSKNGTGEIEMTGLKTLLLAARMTIMAAPVLTCAALLGPVPAAAEVALPPEYLAGTYLSDLPADPDAALGQLDGILDTLTGQGEPDPRIVFDITRQQVDILIDAGRAEEAGTLLVTLADYVAGNREVLDRDPAALLSEAAELFLMAGAFNPARDALDALLVEQSDGGLPGEVLAATHEQLAALEEMRGDQAMAEAEREMAAELTAPVTTFSRAAGVDHVAVDVYYATDRVRTSSTTPALVYRSGRGAGLDYGVATVTIPLIHRPGAIETPSIWRAEFGLSPSKHIVLKSVTPMQGDAFFGDLHRAIDDRSRKEIFVFIHGYNTTFEQAAKRAAQMAYDMHFAGLPVLYSWPSLGKLSGYISDAAVVRVSARRLTWFLEDLVTRTGAENVNIVAHSMGNRALTDALELMARRQGIGPGDPPLFDQIVFAAPDVDAGLFAEMMPTIRPLAQRLTLYASERDWALFASRRLHGDAPRAGQGGADLLVQDDFDSVDMTLLGEDMLSHTYFSSALLDLFTLFNMNLDPAERCGLSPSEQDGNKVAWRYDPARCDDSVLLDVLSVFAAQPGLDRDDVVSLVRRAVPDPAMAQEVVNEALDLLFR